MASTRDLMIIAEQDGFKKRVKWNMDQVAIYALSVPVTLQVPYSKTVLLGTASIEQMAIAVVSNSNIAAVGNVEARVDDLYGISDQLLYDTINSLFPVFAQIVS